MTEDYGPPISYLILEEGTPVYTSDGKPAGEVKRVLAVPEDDIYDGLIIKSAEGDRFVDAEHGSRLFERGVVLDIASEHLEHLPDPAANPAALGVTPDDTVHHSTGSELGHMLRRAWDRISGNY